MAGARMVAFAPVSIAMNGLGLNVTGFSYHGTLWICAVACRDMMPDPAFFADCLRASFARLVSAAEKLERDSPGVSAAASGQRPGKAAAKPKARGAAAKPRVRGKAAAKPTASTKAVKKSMVRAGRPKKSRR
jgi:diacylglycerol O-acyltransferase